MPSSNARPAMVTMRTPATLASTVQVIHPVLDERPALGRRSPPGAVRGPAVAGAAPAVASLLRPRIMLSRGAHHAFLSRSSADFVTLTPPWSRGIRSAASTRSTPATRSARSPPSPCEHEVIRRSGPGKHDASSLGHGLRDPEVRRPAPPPGATSEGTVMGRNSVSRTGDLVFSLMAAGALAVLPLAILLFGLH